MAVRLCRRLGPPPPARPPYACPTCICNQQDDWRLPDCSPGCCGYSYQNCACTADGCGPFWAYSRNGHCGSPGSPSYPRCT
ncbi:hypothetical protein ACFQV2_05845 [Actinokineospora soli]|uniref:Uncharacterized protein n=1 Tax=Actinokineospora soli TaxID=1048753 RepID=A0ABW2TI79_9PSEU